MGLTGRTQKRRQRYHDQAMNDFLPINSNYGLLLTYAELDAAAWALGSLKADAKNRRGLGDWLKFFTNPNGGFVASLSNWDKPYGGQSKLEFQLSAAALSFTAVYKYGANNRKGSASKVFAGYAAFPQGSGYESGAVGRQDFLANRAYFAGRSIYESNDESASEFEAAAELNAQTQNRRGADLAGGFNYERGSVKEVAPFEIASVRSANKALSEAVINTLSQITSRVVEGFRLLNNCNYNAGGQLLAHFRLSIRRNAGGLFNTATSFELREANLNYNKGLRASSLQIPAYAQRFFWRLEHGEEISTPPPPQNSDNDRVQADPVTSVEEKAKSYFWEVLGRVQGFLEELREDGDLFKAGSDTSQGWCKVVDLDFKPPADGSWYFPPSVFSRDEPKEHQFHDNSEVGFREGWKAEFYIRFEPSATEAVAKTVPFSWEQLEAFSNGEAGASLDKNALVAWYESSFKAGVFGYELIGKSELNPTGSAELFGVCVGEFVFVVGGGRFGEAEESDAFETYSEFATPIAKSDELKGFDFNQI